MTTIHSLAQFRGTYAYRFPTRPVRDLRVVRVEGSLVAIDPKGRIYSNVITERKKSIVGDLRHWSVSRLARGLQRLGAATEQLAADLEAASAAEQRRREAQYALSDFAKLKRLGVTLTATQRAKLEAIANAKEGEQ